MITRTRSSRLRTLITRGAAAVVVVGSLLAAGQSPASAASAPTYQVTITGTVSGNPFRINGTVTLLPTQTTTTNNGVNPYEACLRAGFPAGAPQAGAIWYGSSTSCFPYRRTLLDLVYASASGPRYDTRPDGRLQAVFANTWTARSSLTACPYSPVDGWTSYSIDASSISGRLELRGYGGASCGWSTYSASFTGTRTA